jgi:hypothetical protein
MRLRELIVGGLALAVFAAYGCGTDPLVGPGTNTPYNLGLVITSPTSPHAFAAVGDSVAYTWEVVDLDNNIVVPNAVLTTQALSDTNVVRTTCYTISKAKGVAFSCLKAHVAGKSSTLTDTYLNVNTGTTLTATATMTVP